MKRKLLCAVTVICLVLSATFSACTAKNEKNKYSAYSLDYFDTAAIITGYEYTQEEFDAVADDILAQLAEYHKLYTIYLRFDGMENLCTVNELVDGAHRTVTVDRKIIDMLLYAKDAYSKTNGKMNVAMGSVLSLWHDYRTIGMDNPELAELPPMQKLQDAALHTDINGLIIDEENCTVTLTDKDMKLDVGAVAKGYATERIALYLEEKGISGYVLNIGGNVRTVGSKPDGEPWLVGVENPNGEGYLSYLQLEGQSVVTSGSYQRYYTVDGKQYHHIIDPETLLPAEYHLSVSVICESSALADVLSTALFCMPQSDGAALIEAMPDVEALWVAKDGTQITSSGFSKYLKNN